MNFLRNKYFTDIHILVRKAYIARIVYTTLFLVGCIPVLIKLNAGFCYYLAMTAMTFIWPHLALFMAVKSKDQKWFEKYINMTLEPVILGIWVPYLQFNPLAIIALVAILGSGAIVTGGVRSLLIRMAALCFSLVLGTIIFGFHYNPESSLLLVIIVGCIIVAATYTQAFIDYNTSRKLNATRKLLKNQKLQLEMLSSKLSKYLSPQIYNSIFTGKQDVRIETTRKKLTIFFSDIQNFTQTTDSMEAEDLSALLNNYLNEMTGIAIKYGGTIDKYIGDAIMIFFGDPETKGEKEDAVNCVSMAISMRQCMNELRQDWLSRGIVSPLHIRIGINTGYCTVGNFGSEQRLDYTIIGGQVNLASRLESNAKPGQILISVDTYLLVKDAILCREYGEITVKGIIRPVRTYQVIDFQKPDKAGDDILYEDGNGINVKIDLKQAAPARVIDILENLIKKVKNRN